jgi:hypothetical protein
VKVGNVTFVGRAPVVKVRGAEVVPSSRTCLMRYVVLGSRPATRKLVLSPGTMGSGAVLSQDGLGPGGLNSTVIVLPAEGGALYRATRGLDVGLITAPVPTTRDCAV